METVFIDKENQDIVSRCNYEPPVHKGDFIAIGDNCWEVAEKKWIIDKGILVVNVKQNDVYISTKRKHIGIICLNKHDFRNYLKRNNITGVIGEPSKTFISGNITYIGFSCVCDTSSWDIDDFKETEMAKNNKEYSEL